MVENMRVLRGVVLLFVLGMVATVLHLSSKSGDTRITRHLLIGLWDLTGALEIDINARHPNDVQGKLMSVSTKFIRWSL